MGLVKSKLPQQSGAEISDDAGQLVRELDAADAATRRNAARRLAGQREAVTALAARLRIEREPSVVEALLAAIGRAGGRTAIVELLELLRDDDAARRNGAIETLQEMDPGEVLGEIGGLFDDADSDVRIFALGVLGPVAPSLRGRAGAAGDRQRSATSMSARPRSRCCRRSARPAWWLIWRRSPDVSSRSRSWHSP